MSYLIKIKFIYFAVYLKIGKLSVYDVLSMYAMVIVIVHGRLRKATVLTKLGTQQRNKKRLVSSQNFDYN